MIYLVNEQIAIFVYVTFLSSSVLKYLVAKEEYKQDLVFIKQLSDKIEQEKISETIIEYSFNAILQEIIEKNIYPTGKFIYCTFKTWHPRLPIKYEDIVKGAEFVLDNNALSTWQPRKGNDNWDGGMMM